MIKFRANNIILRSWFNFWCISLGSGFLFSLLLLWQHHSIFSSGMEELRNATQVKQKEYLSKIKACQQNINDMQLLVEQARLEKDKLIQASSVVEQKAKLSELIAQQKVSRVKQLQLDLTKIEEKIDHKYQNLLEKKEATALLRAKCELNRKSSACANMEIAKETTDALGVQLRALQQQRYELTAQVDKLY